MFSETAGSPSLLSEGVRDVESKVAVGRRGAGLAGRFLSSPSFIQQLVLHAPIPGGQNCILKASGGCWFILLRLLDYTVLSGVAQILFVF